MLFQFKAKDESLWRIDTDHLWWAQIEFPPAQPEGVPDAEVEPTKLQSGTLINQGYGIYAMDGRSEKTEAPGAGLSVIGALLIGHGNTLEIWLKANAPISDFTMPVPFSNIEYKVYEG